MSHTELIIFADDWGRHPSSAQHLVRHLLEDYPVTWVNTVGTRRMSLSIGDLTRAASKCAQWFAPRRNHVAAVDTDEPTVLSPTMYPGFRSPWQRRLNQRMLTRALSRQFAGQPRPARRIAVTTLPILADVVGRIEVDRWVYYCVDDFSVWPGLDATVMQTMEQQLVGKVDTVIAASEHLADRLVAMGAQPQLLTHGIDLDHWRPRHDDRGLSPRWPTSDKPVALFWGLIDPRLNVQWCEHLARAGVEVVLVGPRQDAPAELAGMTGVTMPGRVDYQHLPYVAGFADVLVMPYADLPVTRAMQPLKFKEYLATGKPVVAAALPAVKPWADAADLVDNAQAFVSRVLHRLEQGLDDRQREARQRLVSESWTQKARQFEAMLLDDSARQQAA